MTKYYFFFVFFCYSVFAQAQLQVPRLSPKPSKVHQLKENILHLNGEWQFSCGNQQGSIHVPGEWTMQGYTVVEGQKASYIRIFTLPNDWENERVKLRFDAVSSHCQVFINKQKVGEHEGGMVPFEFDITTLIQTGTNEIQVNVEALTVSDRMGCVSQYAVHTVGGLLRKVSLFVLPTTNISSMNVYTTLDKHYKHASLHIETEVINEFDKKSLNTDTYLHYTLTNPLGKVVASKKNAVHNKTSIQLAIPNALLWNSEQPHLYTLTTKLYTNNILSQTNEQHIGLRQIEIKNQELLVNGKGVKLRGVNRHETHPLHGRSLTPELCVQDVLLFKEANCNYIRTSHYPPSEEFLTACDQFGVFVESETAITWIQHHASPIWKKWNYLDQQYFPYMVQANYENVLAGRKHPSIIMWSLCNESRWSPLWERVNTAVKQLDPSRPTVFHDQTWGTFNNAASQADIANQHYPNIEGIKACDTMMRPTLFGEYAHLSCYNRAELVTDPGIRSAYNIHLEAMYDSMYYQKKCIGGALWSGIDDVFHLPNGQIVGYGPWGFIDGWRRKKPEFAGVYKAYAPVKLRNIQQQGSIVSFEVENRFNFINLKDLKWEFTQPNKVTKNVVIDLKPGERKIVQVDLGSTSLKSIRLIDSKGFICAQEYFKPQRNAPEKLFAVELNESKQLIQIDFHADELTKSVYISKETGVITQISVNKQTVLSQGPIFCIVPMNANDAGKPNVAGESYQNTIHPIKDYPFYVLYSDNLKHRKEGKNIIVEMDTYYFGGAQAKMKYTFIPINATIKVDYQITLAADVNPRQFGLLCQMPPSMGLLEWDCNNTNYADSADIARSWGIAPLAALYNKDVEIWGKQPFCAWKDDANELGSADFRSTKEQFIYAQLGNKEKIRFVGQNKQAIRSWLQDGAIQVLIADYNNTGAEPFYGSPFRSHSKLTKGDILTGQMVFY